MMRGAALKPNSIATHNSAVPFSRPGLIECFSSSGCTPKWQNASCRSRRMNSTCRISYLRDPLSTERWVPCSLSSCSQARMTRRLETMSCARGSTILAWTLARWFPCERFMSITMRLFVQPSAFCLLQYHRQS